MDVIIHPSYIQAAPVAHKMPTIPVISLQNQPVDWWYMWRVRLKLEYVPTQLFSVYTIIQLNRYFVVKNWAMRDLQS